MDTYSFNTVVHQDRFSDLAAIVGDHMVIIEPLSMEDQMVGVNIRGEADITRKLDRVLQTVENILTSAPVFEDA